MAHGTDATQGLNAGFIDEGCHIAGSRAEWVCAPIRLYVRMILLGILLESVWSYWEAPGAVPDDAPGTPTHESANGSQGPG
jgi:hypothetical protein